MQTQTAGLGCAILRPDPSAPVARIAIFCHGYGAPGDDLVGVAGELLVRGPRELTATEFIFPAAPLSLEYEFGFEGRAWWPINMLQLQHMAQTGDLTELENHVPPELADCRRRLQELIAARLAQHDLPSDAWIVGGFSQGAMLAVDVALHALAGPSGLIVWSGTLISADRWRELARQHPPIRIVQSHGVYDSLLPFSGAEKLRNLLIDSGHMVQFLPFRGEHSISEEGLRAAAQIIAGASSS